MVEELLEKIPPETCWAITAKILWRFIVMRDAKHLASELIKEEGVIAPVLGWDTVEEISTKIWTEGGRKFLPMIEEMFNIPVEDAVGAAKLVYVGSKFVVGPETKIDIVEATRERAVVRFSNCISWERQKELEMDPELLRCPPAHKSWVEVGLKAINPKMTTKLTKALPWGDPYCEFVHEFKEE